MIDIYVDGDIVGGNDDGTTPANAYDTLFEAEAENLDLDTAADDCTIHCKGADDGTAAVVFAGWTNTTQWLYVEAAVGDRHDTTRGTGYRLVITDDWADAITISNSRVTLNGLAVSNSHANANYGIRVDVPNVDILNCLSYDNPEDGIYIENDHDDVSVINCVSYGNGASGIRAGDSGENQHYIANCTCINNGDHGIEGVGFRHIYSYNNYCGGNTNGDFGKEANDNCNHFNCMAADTSFADNAFATETNCTDSIALSTSAGSYLTNVTATSENCNIGNDSSLLIDAGADLDGNAWWPTDVETAGDGTDYAGTTRSATWDIGADERIVAVGGNAGIMTTNTSFWGPTFIFMFIIILFL